MLLIEGEAQMSFKDHLDSGIRYRLPHAIALTETHSGAPDFFLLRYAGDFTSVRGGILRSGLELLYDFTEPGDITLNDGNGNVEAEADITDVADRAVTFRPVPFITGYSRLRLRPFGSDDFQTGQWHKIDALEQGNLNVLAYLDMNEAQILHSLLSDGSDVVSMEVYLVYRGLVAGIPWIVRFDTELLNAHIQAALGEDPATSGHIVAAFKSLPESGLSWHFVGDAAINTGEVPVDTIRTEAALHGLNHLFQPVDRPDYLTTPRYRYVPPDSTLAPDYSYTLFNYRQEERAHIVNWSITGLFERLTPEEREKLFPTVSQVSPFARVRVHIINSLPFDPAFLTSVTVETRNIGARGIFENRSFQFTAGDEQVAGFSTFQPVLTNDLELQYRITAILAPPTLDEWPVVIQRDFVAVEHTVIDVNRETAGIDFVHLSADADVFSIAGAVEIVLKQPGSDGPLAAVKLTRETRISWVALPDITPETDLQITCRVQPPADVSEEPITLRDGPLIGREFAVHTYQLERLDPDVITVKLDAQASVRYPFVAFEVQNRDDSDEGILRTLEPGRESTWRIFRPGIFAPLFYRYRLHLVARDENGGTLPMVVTQWFDASANRLTLDADFITEHMIGA